MITNRLVAKTTFDASVQLAARLTAARTSPDDVDVAVAAHPEGRKRGGTVCLYSDGDLRVYYDEGACEWFVYDDIDD